MAERGHQNLLRSLNINLLSEENRPYLFTVLLRLLNLMHAERCGDVTVQGVIAVRVGSRLRWKSLGWPQIACICSYSIFRSCSRLQVQLCFCPLNTDIPIYQKHVSSRPLIFHLLYTLSCVYGCLLLTPRDESQGKGAVEFHSPEGNVETWKVYVYRLLAPLSAESLSMLGFWVAVSIALSHYRERLS